MIPNTDVSNIRVTKQIQFSFAIAEWHKPFLDKI